jgi:hypothetical protein
VRLRYTKLARAAFISHLDVMRLLARVFRRAGVPIGYTLGFHPKPNMTFGPALSLGIPSLGELVEVHLDQDTPGLTDRLNEVTPEGVRFLAERRVPANAPNMAKHIHAADWLVRGEPTAPVADDRIVGVDVIPAGKLGVALGWDAPRLTRVRVRVGPEGSIRPRDVATMLGWEGADIARLGLVGLAGADAYDPLEATSGSRAPYPGAAAPGAASTAAVPDARVPDARGG